MADQFKACSIDGCNGNAHHSALGRKGFCVAHYSRLRRHGDPLGGGTPHGEPLSFFNEVVMPYEGDDCLIWPYNRNGNGYGMIRMDGDHGVVSRFICEKVHGAPPEPDYEAAHSCGNGHLGCVTKGHLSWKTGSQNQADRLGHGTHQLGERNASSQLTEDQPREILSLKDIKSRKEIAAQFGVCYWTVRDIHTGRRWAHLT